MDQGPNLRVGFDPGKDLEQIRVTIEIVQQRFFQY